jgi:hypothetical protein
MFDRRGPDGMHGVRVWAYGLMVFGLTAGTMLATGFSWLVIIPIAGTAALLVVAGAAAVSTLAGNSYTHIMMSGASTPYAEQYSYQESLVMKGEVDAALSSFESVIAGDPSAVTARVKAAELYLKERTNHRRAYDLFHEVQRIPGVSVGDYVYATNRLVDLFIGPLGEPGKALVELRKLIEKFPDTRVAANARLALLELRSRQTNESR